MDRFIENHRASKHTLIYYLKSNMDRFIDVKCVIFHPLYRHLKSNMYRFIDPTLNREPA